MMKKTLYPLRFTPVYKDYIWGGSRIPKAFNRPLPDGIYAESWEITDRDDGMSMVENGTHAGQTLRQLLEQSAAEILGTNTNGTRFPLLFKLIDANQKLSVQVHPNDETAAQFGGEPKTEMWYMLSNTPAQVYCGFKNGITKANFLQAVANGTSGETLRVVPLKKGEAVFVPGGRIHAIDAGCLILEIQQNSNTTYRLYDWDRVDAAGQSRPLHIEQAINVIRWNDTEDPRTTPTVLADTENLRLTEIQCGPYFRLEKLECRTETTIQMDGSTFHALFIAEGEITISWDGGTDIISSGTSLLIPAALPHYTLKGKATILRTTVPA